MQIKAFLVYYKNAGEVEAKQHDEITKEFKVIKSELNELKEELRAKRNYVPSFIEKDADNFIKSMIEEGRNQYYINFINSFRVPLKRTKTDLKKINNYQHKDLRGGLKGRRNQLTSKGNIPAGNRNFFDCDNNDDSSLEMPVGVNVIK